MTTLADTLLPDPLWWRTGQLPPPPSHARGGAPRTVPGPFVAALPAAAVTRPACPPGASAGRGTDRAGWQAAAGQQPRNHRVGVPHLARPQLVSAPPRARQGADEVEEATRPAWVVGQGLGAGDRLVGVGDCPVPPAAYLVAKHAEARHPAAGDWAL